MEEDRGKIRKKRRLKRRGRLSLFNGDNIKRNEIGEFTRQDRIESSTGGGVVKREGRGKKRVANRRENWDEERRRKFKERIERLKDKKELIEEEIENGRESKRSFKDRKKKLKKRRQHGKRMMGQRG
ncbi:hypothetical protein ALC53_03030 [Atta colombica]|uniref:Uncharacterized protein n=1 Tax=Atta colombica TaxID=520822 RepID=A0A195BPU9_9HYME|nr:hypothetical protein ALC53_03030 [Atta colombica]